MLTFSHSDEHGNLSEITHFRNRLHDAGVEGTIEAYLQDGITWVHIVLKDDCSASMTASEASWYLSGMLRGLNMERRFVPNWRG